MQYRRPTYSALEHVYHQQRNMGLDKPSSLDARSRTELLIAVCLAPGMVVNLRAPIHREVYASDASSLAGGITVADLPGPLRLPLYDLAEFGGAHVRLDMPNPSTDNVT